MPWVAGQCGGTPAHTDTRPWCLGASRRAALIPAPGEALGIQRGQAVRRGDHGFGQFYSPAQVAVPHVADRGAGYGAVPSVLHRMVQEHAHEAVIKPDRPAIGRRHAWQDRACQDQPSGDEGSTERLGGLGLQ